jgi:protein-S-isoprenylcysteine O-methyltransferase Ste14
LAEGAKPVLTARIFETSLVAGMFVSYLALWRAKRASDIRKGGIDPDVLSKASTPVQAYFGRLVRVMTGLVVGIIVLHAVGPTSWPPLTRLGALDPWWFDTLGASVGIGGLALCFLAQATMGSSWRVGIDADHETGLVTRGIFGLVRNPTYVGLHLVSVGLFLIWPTTLAAIYGVLFFVIMDIQVRCEEEHLSRTHGDLYRAYVKRTWRYVPRVY